MTIRKLSNEQIKALDFQTDQLYESFKRAVNTQAHQDSLWTKELFTAFGKSLTVAANSSGFLDWNRNTQRANIFDKYLLPYVLGNIPSFRLEQLILMRQFRNEILTKETDVTINTLKQAIDNNKVPYRKIQPMTISLAEISDFTAIVRALEYVREKY